VKVSLEEDDDDDVGWSQSRSERRKVIIEITISNRKFNLFFSFFREVRGKKLYCE
jgi:hypothetical protein